MATYLIEIRRLLVCGVAVLALVCVGVVPSASAEDIKVTAAEPNYAVQGTVNLDVTITGSGFTKGAQAAFLLTGTENPGGVIVNRTTFVTSKKLTANINVALDAVVAKRDIKVTCQGRTGKGIDLFSVNAKPQTEQWDWHVGVVRVSDTHLIDDGGGVYEDTGNDLSVHVRVTRESQNSYRFLLKIWKVSGRQIGLEGLVLDPSTIWYYDPWPGIFPAAEGDCSAPEPCVKATCTDRLQTFLNHLHPFCGYGSAILEITVPLDIESMTPGQASLVDGDVVFDIWYTNEVLRDPENELHNMDALSFLPAPLSIERTAENTWTIGVDSGLIYMDYGEFYWGIFRAKRPTPKYPMTVDGPFRFETTWTRSPAGS